ncbi:hypothetical protein FOT62_24730 [Serratia marcescens]|uniref:Fimbrial protein n=1 Tax=Serratia marcescens TaxID=615 RepID=A0A5C7BQ97_SERMA|nr:MULTISPECIES: hypothetical protein [Serratia]TXE24472.1 hypothetical protein FOT62_24730 [Serratia marcescens]TXE53308.1 hypothetical protein FOT56_27165 [Serratia marcescens]
MAITYRPALPGLLGLALAGLPAAGPGRAAELPVSWEVTQGTCAVAVQSLDLGAVDPTSLIGKANYTWVNRMPLPLTLSCTGGMLGGGQPQITVIGQQTIAGVFDNLGTAKGVGIALLKPYTTGTTEPERGAGCGNDRDIEGTNRCLYIPKPGGFYQAGEIVDGVVTITPVAAVTCGPSSECTRDKAAGGTVKAHIGFEFVYP